MILTLFYKGLPMFDFDGFGSINALAAADTLDASNPLLKFSTIDDSVAGLNIVRLTDDAPGRAFRAASNLFFNSSPCSIKNLAAFTALFADDISAAAANIPPRLALLPCLWCLRLRVKCAECERLRLIVLLFLRPCPCPCPRPRRFVMILDIFFYILAKYINYFLGNIYLYKEIYLANIY